MIYFANELGCLYDDMLETLDYLNQTTKKVSTKDLKEPEKETNEPVLRKIRYSAVLHNNTATISADIPGTSKEDLEISVLNNTLNVVAKNNLRHYEFSVNVSPEWNLNDAKAKLENGLLSIDLSKKEIHKQLIKVQ